jgi:hypothetical protein
MYTLRGDSAGFFGLFFIFLFYPVLVEIQLVYTSIGRLSYTGPEKKMLVRF